MNKLSTAVMNRRLEAADSLDFFPTPPWATRAFLTEFLTPMYPLDFQSVWEPAAGEGHMTVVLKEFFRNVYSSDIFDYGKGFEVGSFIDDGSYKLPPKCVRWIITNPPFNSAADFAERALEEDYRLAIFARTNWLEGVDRYSRLWEKRPPQHVVVYSDRVPLLKGRYAINASSATSYSWFVWDDWGSETQLSWIRPGAKKRHFKAADLALSTLGR